MALLFVAIVGLFMPPSQNSPKAQKLKTLEVTVKDTAGTFIVGATITLKGVEDGTVKILQTDAKGFVKFYGLPMGDYECRIDAHGYKSTVLEIKFGAYELGQGNVVFLKGDGVINPVENYKEEPYSPVNEKFNVYDLKKDIKKNLPLGSTPLEVSEFLKERGIDHGELQVARHESDYPGEENPKLIRAMIRRVRKGLFGYWGISMSFRFDENDRLIDYKVQWSGLGD